MKAFELSQTLMKEMPRVVVGQPELCRMLSVCLLAGGHVLMEGAPGLGKTLAARTLSKIVNAPFKRVQFTPDLMPSDIIGTNVYDAGSGNFVLRKGPLFTSLLLADEINRTPPKTQSALLEAMEEGRVTIDGVSYSLPTPFMVLATQNPIEYEGTYPLPEAQLDRFMMKLSVGYPPREEAKRLLRNVQGGFDAQRIDEISPCLSPKDILEAREEVKRVQMEESLLDYVLSILEATRKDPGVYLGASPRAGIALMQAGRALAAMDERDYCTPEDLKMVAKNVLRHRLILTPDAEIEGFTSDVILGVCSPACRYPNEPLWYSPALCRASIGRALPQSCVSCPFGLFLADFRFFFLFAILLLVLDFALAPGAKLFEAQRSLPRAFEQQREGTVSLTITSKGPVGVTLRLTDSPPKTFKGGREISDLILEQGAATCQYAITPTQRGAFPFGNCYVELRGRWGLAVKRFHLICPDTAVVYPDLTAMRHYRMLADHGQLSREDSAIHKVRGIGTEFAGIREYAPDDDWRKVNWKATARARKLMTNVYDVEKNREVVLCIDAGRWMQAGSGGVSRLDRALEMAAALMQVALSSGDKVGLLLYHMEATLYLPPEKGSMQASKILSALYDTKATGWPSSGSAISGMLRRKLKRRAFICVFSYLDSPREAAAFVSELAPILRRHAVFFSSLADEGLEDLATKETVVPCDVYLKAAAVHRKKSVIDAAELLVRNGIGAHAAEPSELLTRSVRHYLSVKGRPF